MQREHRDGARPILTALFIDYDNIYASLLRADEGAADRFAKDAERWLKAIESGGLISPTQGGTDTINRRLVMTRCYGNPMPRKVPQQDKTDSNSFTFVRHHFQRAGFEMIDCPATAQLTNSSDIRIVMDVRDMLTHDTYFDEFIILSGDADYTPVLHRLRAHARRTVIFASDNTVAQYKAISDGEVRESDLIELLLTGPAQRRNEPVAAAASQGAAHVNGELRQPKPAPAVAQPVPAPAASHAAPAQQQQSRIIDPSVAAAEILGLISQTVQDAGVPLAVGDLADEATHVLGAAMTRGTQWAGAGSLEALLVGNLPAGFAMRGTPAFVVPATTPKAEPARVEAAAPVPQPPRPAAPVVAAERAPAPNQAPAAAAARSPAQRPAEPPRQASAPALNASTAAPPNGTPVNIEEWIATIHEACHAPPLSPPDYRIVFDVMAAEIGANGLLGPETVAAIVARASHQGLELKPEDVRFILDVVREADPWFDHGASAPVFASRFRNHVVSRCRAQGLQLPAAAIDLIDAWFAASVVERRAQQRGARPGAYAMPPGTASARHEAGAATVPPGARAAERPALASAPGGGATDEWHEPAVSNGRMRPAEENDEFGAMPRIVRSRVQA